MSKFLRLVFFSALLFGALIGCESEVDTNDNASGFAPAPEQDPGSENDDFFHANRVTLGSTVNDSVSLSDPVDYFYVQLPLNSYRSYSIQISNLSGDVDVEMYNAFLNKESWSDNDGLSDELIKYWRNYTDLDNNIIFLKVIHRESNAVNYTMSIL